MNCTTNNIISEQRRPKNLYKDNIYIDIITRVKICEVVLDTLDLLNRFENSYTNRKSRLFVSIADYISSRKIITVIFDIHVGGAAG